MGFRRLMCLAVLAALPGVAQTEPFTLTEWNSGDRGRFRGAALDTAGILYTWGDRLVAWNLTDGQSEVLVSEGPGFGDGGCLMEVDDDGSQDVVLLENSADGGLGNLVWFGAPRWERHLIDSGAQFRDCAEATLDGRRGVVLIHRFLQIRFYQTPDNPEQKWPYRELYSIYTPSKQGGLLLADIDGDGNTDILAGNYWLRNPGDPELHWRLFAINLWSEAEESALSVLKLHSITGSGFPDLVASQSDMAEARLALFARPADPTHIWPERRLEGMLGLRYPRALAAGDLDADGHADLVVGENNGPGSRLMLFYNEAGKKFLPTLIAETPGLLNVWITDINGDSTPDILGVGPTFVGVWLSQPRK